MTLTSYANFEERLTSGLKKDEKFGKFSPSKCQNWDFDIPSKWDFCPKYKRYDLKIYRGVMCHDNEE